ncbi:hypothetical protein AQS70_13795 [Pseudomonas endophytica]|uniref:Uncharacterized protein n=1 Tax=Pseudomonas endophytica TaxID=1563157 RepID=A0A0Q0SZN9_9PSED|nr:hypothetical protein [Pseudomonas endophytica]KQB52573.1 hypothetical protein AQS70_13795 [Pseudomonas endophytica]
MASKLPIRLLRFCKKVPFINSVRVFRDNVFTSRTLILPSGACLAVAKGQACAFDDEQYQYLDAHTDFEPLTE